MKKEDRIKQKAKQISREFLIVNFGIVALGILLLVYPGESKDIICRVLGSALAVWGVFKLIEYIRMKKNEIFGSFALVQGCALLCFGVYIAFKPDIIAAFVTVVLCIILFISGIIKLQYAMEFSSMKSKGWQMQALGAVAMIAGSVIAFVNPFGASNILMMFLGAFLIASGIWDIITMIYIRRFIKSYKIEAEEVRRDSSKKINDERFVDAEIDEYDDE